MTRRTVAATAVTLVALAIPVAVLSEAALASEPGDRATLYRVFTASVLGTGVAGWWLTRTHRRTRSLRWTLLVVAVAAVLVAAGVVAAATSAMFLTAAELQLVLAALLLGAGLGTMIAMSVAGPLTSDLRRLAATARRVADGDLAARTRVDRGDEVGELAGDLDRLIEQLALLERRRSRDDEARRRLFTSIGHDLRTPLASLRAALEALEDGLAPDTDRYLRSMSHDVTLLSSMVQDLFVLARLDAGALHLDRVPIDLAELVDGAVEAVVAIADRDGVRVRATSGPPVRVEADPGALDRVLRNLLDNAIRHAPHGSEVEVTVTEQAGWGTVNVRDHGPGFPADFADRAFEHFSRADPARERGGGGAGLGLAIARELVDTHGGSIWIEPTAGASVSFRVPTIDGERKPPT